MVKTDYPEQSVVYTSSKNVLKFPGEFYIVPYQVNMLPEATLTWLASFDGHKEIFFLGFDDRNDKVINQVKWVMDAFPDVTYTRVFWNGSVDDKEDNWCPDAWKWCQNFREMNKQKASKRNKSVNTLIDKPIFFFIYKVSLDMILSIN